MAEYIGNVPVEQRQEIVVQLNREMERLIQVCVCVCTYRTSCQGMVYTFDYLKVLIRKLQMSLSKGMQMVITSPQQHNVCVYVYADNWDGLVVCRREGGSSGWFGLHVWGHTRQEHLRHERSHCVKDKEGEWIMEHVYGEWQTRVQSCVVIW